MSKRAHNFKDLTGMKFGKLTVIKDTGKNYKSEKGKSSPIFLCKCECGSEKEISANSLRAGAKSCDCTKGKWARNKLEGSEYSGLLARYKLEAKNRGYSFNLNKEQFLELIKQKCFYCGTEPLSFVKYLGTIYKYNGIDRVDNGFGYEPENVVTCCKPCNSKKKATSKEMIIKAYNFLKENGKI